MTIRTSTLLITTVAMASAPSLASAHPAMFHHVSMAQGALHPLTGLDHVLAMTSVGLWAAQRGGRATWALPLTFVGVMLAGGAMGMAGVALPMLEPMIAASVLVLGLLIASATALPLRASAGLVGLFALAHGNAHGLEAPETGATLAYAFGFAASTAALHGLGVAMGRVSQGARWTSFVRAGGAVSAGVGALLFFV
jgi:urease accessory protein